MARLSLVLFLVAVCAEALGGPAEWPLYRHDRHLTCRSEGAGGLAEPTLSWRYDLRGWEALVEVSPGEGQSDVVLTPPAEPVPLSAEEEAAWGLTARLVDLAGDGKLVPSPPYAAKIIADRPGLQWPDTVMENNESGWCVLYGMEDGRRKEIWRSQRFDVYQGPHPIVADANADGQLDVIACPHYQIVVMDGRTGEVIQQLRWHDGRNYGHFIARNIDDDPALEFLVLADFYTHIDLIDNDGTDLKLLWTKGIELKIEAKEKILRPRWDALQDLDGDGRFEVITNLYNETGDKQWHLMVYDALTGDTVADHPGTFLSGLEDVDGDGSIELFCCETSALFEPTSSNLRVLNLRGGRLASRFEAYGAWATTPHPYPLYINSNVAHADRNVATGALGEGRRCFFVTRAEDRDRWLTCFEPRHGGFQVRWSIDTGARTGPPRIAGCREDRVLTGVPLGPRTRLRLQQYRCSSAPVAWTRTMPERARWSNLIAADLAGAKAPTIVSAAGNRQVVALDVSRPRPRVRWRHPGAGTLAAADLDGDGAKEVALLGWEPSGEGSATIVRGSGKVLWRTPVAGFPGPLEPWNFGTLTTLAVGQLDGQGGDDLLVFARRSTMHSDEGYALRGQDGELLWTRTTVSDGERNWGFGGTPVAVFDTDADGCEDIISLYPVNLTIVRGRDGEQVVGRSAAGDSIFPGIWAAYAEPAVFDYDRDGRPELAWNGGYCLGMTDLAGETRWAITPAASGFPVDADGDGVWEIASPLGSALRWLDPADGAVRWSMDLPGSAGQVAIADVNGDGAEEVLVSCGPWLVAAHAKGGEPTVLWQLEAPAAIQEFILADTDADGALEGVLMCADGWLYGVDGA